MTATEQSDEERRRGAAPSCRIGVFDSGVGGLTVVRALRRVLPGADVLYLGDTARVPYGSKSARTVERYALGCLRFLLHRQVDLVMVACNTVSATALAALAALSPVPLIGAVEPGAEAAAQASQGGRIGLLATRATVGSGAYPRALAARAPAVRLSAVACPLLVPLAEEGWLDDEIAAAVARRYLGQLFAADAAVDTLLLGCTHYPLLAPLLGRVAAEVGGRPVTVVDSAAAMAAVAARVVGPAAGGRGALHCFATDDSRLEELGPRFLGEPWGGCELVDLGDLPPAQRAPTGAGA
jgi:glutamate racemase